MSTKAKSSFFCQNCGAQSPKWLGRCPSCNEWNTFVEELVQKEDKNTIHWNGEGKTATPIPKLINEINFNEEARILAPDKELNRVLGGGIVPGSLVLIGGEPGIGKSTLMLQVGLGLKQLKVLYISGEESEQQIKLRAERIQFSGTQFYILTETSTRSIFKQIEGLKPEFLIIDSIQTLQSDLIESAPGSISQVRQCTAELMKYAKESGVPVFLIGHITKEGTLAGPKVLEHMVDTVLQFEGDRHHSYRILRTTKNRFGSTSELGIYEMRDTGLKEVSNPSEILISQKDGLLNGVAIAAMLEGNRPLLIELQSLVSVATYGTPQRSSTGFDAKRLNMLLAVLEKRCGVRVNQQDVFLNVAGGLKVEDPSIDLAVCASIVSSFHDIAVPVKTCFAAEIGLGGEIRAVNRIEQRIAESERLGFEEIYISKFNLKGLNINSYRIKIRAVSKLEEVFEGLFG